MDQYEEMEKEWRLREEKREQEMNVMKEAISEVVKSVQTSRKITNLSMKTFACTLIWKYPKVTKFQNLKPSMVLAIPWLTCELVVTNLWVLGKMMH